MGALLRLASERLASSGIDEPTRESQLLMAHALDISRLAIISMPDRVLNRREFARFSRLVSRRSERVPLAYLRGVQEFYGMEFEVTPDVLVPRPETELLVDAARGLLDGAAAPQIIDAGTGSGCIAVSVARLIPVAWIVATDRSTRALQVARRNSELHSVEDRLRFVQCDFISAIEQESADLIVSNPPYIPSAMILSLQPEVRDYEPRIALDGGEDGLDCYRRLAGQATLVLKRGGRIALEVGAGQAAMVAKILEVAGLASTVSLKDLAGIERVVQAQKP